MVGNQSVPWDLECSRSSLSHRLWEDGVLLPCVDHNLPIIHPENYGKDCNHKPRGKKSFVSVTGTLRPSLQHTLAGLVISSFILYGLCNCLVTVSRFSYSLVKFKNSILQKRAQKIWWLKFLLEQILAFKKELSSRALTHL